MKIIQHDNLLCEIFLTRKFCSLITSELQSTKTIITVVINLTLGMY